MDIVELSIGASIIAVGAFLLAYIRKIKNKLKKYVLRGADEDQQNETY